MKDLMRETIEKLPADATVEDAVERLRFLAKTERGQAQADDGQTISHDEVRARLEM